MTVVVATGELEATEVVLAIATALDARAERPVMWDMTGASLRQLSTDDVRQAARQMQNSLEALRPCRQAALVCSEDADFGIARMLATFASLEGCRLRLGVFRGTDEAQRWLLGE